jgi:hypothetical protein
VKRTAKAAAIIALLASLLTVRAYSTKEVHGVSWLWCDLMVQRGFAVCVIARPLEEWRGTVVVGIAKSCDDWEIQAVVHPKQGRTRMLGFVINKRQWYAS